jgi:hypothetical protein
LSRFHKGGEFDTPGAEPLTQKLLLGASEARERIKVKCQFATDAIAACYRRRKYESAGNMHFEQEELGAIDRPGFTPQ